MMKTCQKHVRWLRRNRRHLGASEAGRRQFNLRKIAHDYMFQQPSTFLQFEVPEKYVDHEKLLVTAILGKTRYIL